MKTNSKITDWLFSPFQFIAGKEALGLGIIVMGLLAGLGYLSGTYFDGVIDVHYGPTIPSKHPYVIHALLQVCSFISLVLVLYVTGRIVSKSSIRFIDIAGTTALAQAPLIIAALLGFIPNLHLNITPGMSIESITELFLQKSLMIVPLIGLTIIPVIWSIVLKYKAYSISVNVKGSKGVNSFVVALLISEVLSKVFINLLGNIFNVMM